MAKLQAGWKLLLFAHIRCWNSLLNSLRCCSLHLFALMLPWLSLINAGLVLPCHDQHPLCQHTVEDYPEGKRGKRALKCEV